MVSDTFEIVQGTYITVQELTPWCLRMRTNEGCGLGLHLLPHIEHPTIRDRVANKTSNHSRFYYSYNRKACNLVLIQFFVLNLILSNLPTLCTYIQSN